MLQLEIEELYASMVFASSDNPKKEWRPTLTVIYENCTPPVADFTFTLHDTVVEFIDQSSTANAWNWDFGDGYSSNLQNPTHTYTEPGDYYCCLTITDPCGNATHCDTIHYCKPPKPRFSYALIGDVVHFKDSSDLANSWSWDFGDGYFSTLQNPTHFYSHYGNYLCCLTIADTCSTAVFCDTVFYCKGPNPQFTYKLDGKLVNFHDTTALIADTLIWDFGDGYYSNLHNPQHIFDQFGTYFVCLTATNNCKLETFCDSVRVKTNGIGDTGFAGIVIRPNPASDKIVISFPPLTADQPVTLTIFNEQGQTLKQMETIISGLKPESAIDISRLSCGLYFLKIGMRDETVIRKFIKL
jgi:PKD repeat protein